MKSRRAPALVLAAGAALAAPPSALAQGGPPAKPGAAKPEAKPGGATAGAAERAMEAAKDLAKGPIDITAQAEGDDARIEAFVAEVEKAIEEKRQRMIASLVQIIQTNPYYQGKADVLFRLAELEWESARHHYFKARKKWESEYEAFLEGTVKVQPPEPKPDYSQALAYYKQILQEFPDYARLDEVMYYLGKGLGTAGHDKEGASYFSRLIKQFPGSKYLPDSYFQVAEYYFNNDLLFAAKTNYLEVLKYKDSSLFQFALYKLAWVYYNLKEWRLAIDTMKQVVAGVGSETQEQQKIQFRNQAMNDLVLSFAEVPDGWKEMRDYFLGLGGEKLVRDKLRKIAGKYIADDKNEEAIQVWRYFLEQYPNEPTAVTWYAAIIDGVKKLEDRKRLERVMRESVVFFDPKGTWAVVNRGTPEIYQQALMLAEDSLDFVATWYHQEAQKVQEKGQATEARAYYTQAAQDYEEFLTRFPGSEKAYKVRFYQAEIYYFELNDWEKAADSYLKVVYLNPQNGEFLEDAAFGSVLAARNIMDPEAAKEAVVAAEARTKRKVKGKDKGSFKGAKKDEVQVYAEDRTLNPQPLTRDEERFIEAAESFRKWLPKSNKTPEVMFYAASVLQKKDQLDKAIPQLETIVTYHSKHQYAAHAANSLFGACALLRKWPDVERWARFLVEQKNFQVKKQPQLQEIIAIAVHHQTQDLQAAGKFPEAADKMVALAREFPQHELAPKAMFNAAAIHEQGRRTDRAVELYDEVLRLYPKHEVAPSALFVIGAIYEARTEYEKAADRFEQMQTYKDHEQAPDALYNAGMIREALGRYDGALRALGKYLELYGTRPDAHEVYFHMAEVKEKNGNRDQAEQHYKEYLKRYPKQTLHGMRANLALAKITAGSRRDSAAYLRKVLADYKRLKGEEQTPLANATSAEAQFLIGEHLWQDFQILSLPSPDKVRIFQQAAVDLGKVLQQAAREYFAVFDYKSHGWTVAAATRIGMLYHRFRDNLFNVPMPPGLSEEEAEMYRYLLDEKAFPLEEKAVEAYQRALQLARDNLVYNDWGARAAKNLAEITPEAFPVTGDEIVRRDHRGDFIFGAPPIANAVAPPPPMPEAPPPMPPMPGHPGLAPEQAPPASPPASGAGGY